MVWKSAFINEYIDDDKIQHSLFRNGSMFYNLEVKMHYFNKWRETVLKNETHKITHKVSRNDAYTVYCPG